MSKAGVSALWERGVERAMPEAPHLWSWADLDSLLDAAVAAAGMDDAERRVLVLENPAFKDTHRRGASVNMVVNLQILMPGEMAPPHRHTPNALRFILEGDGGAVTTVNGVACPMEPGDFLLTPGWCWHEHRHDGRVRAVWLDALDVPLHQHLGTVKFEAGPGSDMPVPPASRAFETAGILPRHRSGGGSADQPYSPVYRYPLADVAGALSALTPEADGSRRIRYINPKTGGPAMPGIDCYMLAPPVGAETQTYRSNANMVCLGVAGSGWAQVGDQKISWQKNDIFTLPGGYWISHQADAQDALLFQMTDRETLARLDYLREEVAG